MPHNINEINPGLYSHSVYLALQNAYYFAKRAKHEFVTPEHVMLQICEQKEFMSATKKQFGNVVIVKAQLSMYLDTLDKTSISDYEPEFSECLSSLLEEQENGLNLDNDEYICVMDIVKALFALEDTEVAYILGEWLGKDKSKILDNIYTCYEKEIPEDDYLTEHGGNAEESNVLDSLPEDISKMSEEELYNKMMGHANRLMEALSSITGPLTSQKDKPRKKADDVPSDKMPTIQLSIMKGPLPFFGGQETAEGNPSAGKSSKNNREPWESYATDLTMPDNYHPRPFVGRTTEIDRAIQILHRKNKNNVIFIGEPGVGKTAIIQGIVNKLLVCDMPGDFTFSHLYSIDLVAMLSGASFQGEFENRIRSVLEGIKRKSKHYPCIAYIDEIHNIMGAGSNGNGSMDASNILKPYLEDGTIRFIGCTTYQEYNRRMANNKAIARRFQQIDVLEPSVDECISILEGIIPTYETHHRVKYDKEAIRYAVEKSAALIADRFLPDKAIDIIDEAGAYRHLHPLLNKQGKPMTPGRQKVDVKLITDILSRVCKINAKALSGEDNSSLKTLAENISANIYGQNAAIEQVVRAVQMAKAGLTDTEKPLASLLFVGPTGVGKTEVCKVLAQELGIELIRFDMSEYTEKHTVAKLIGSPAGYVGYDDGGLLTDAIRKTPNCVLLLDEIEKAHADIYNILLQVMDYAKLTDNKGNKADFKNVILIMTSNAGAQFAGQAGVGFGHTTSKGEAMLQTVKKHFKPEFLNRLSSIVTFNDMDKHMASLILDKKLRLLSNRLSAKKVTLSLSDSAREYLLDKGFTTQYGAREIDRTIQNLLTPLLMEAILFGSLTHGGEAKIELENNSLVMRT